MKTIILLLMFLLRVGDFIAKETVADSLMNCDPIIVLDDKESESQKDPGVYEGTNRSSSQANKTCKIDASVDPYVEDLIAPPSINYLDKNGKREITGMILETL